MGKTAKDITLTGVPAPNAIKDDCRVGAIGRRGLRDCRVRGALGFHLAHYPARGGKLKAGNALDVPDIGVVEVPPNAPLAPAAYTAPDSGSRTRRTGSPRCASSTSCCRGSEQRQITEPHAL